MQRVATQTFKKYRDMPYKDQLRYIGLPFLNAIKVKVYKGTWLRNMKNLTKWNTLTLIPYFKWLNVTSQEAMKANYFYNLRTIQRRNSFAISAFGKWNSIPTNIRLSNNINNFKNLLDAHGTFKNNEFDFDDWDNSLNC